VFSLILFLLVSLMFLLVDLLSLAGAPGSETRILPALRTYNQLT